MKILYFISFLVYSFPYDRNGAVNYAYQFAETPNHRCGSFDACTPCSYWGDEACGYSSNGGDSANFVSQCLVKGGGHPPLNDGVSPCRGYPCGFEEVASLNLANCLIQKGWISKCGRLEPPPSYIEAGDVLNYYSDGCLSGAPFSVFITVGGNNPKITSHSNVRVDVSYLYLDNNKPYYQWLHHNAPTESTFTIGDGIYVSACPSGTHEFTLNRTCLTNCPEYYIVNNNNKCVIKPFDINTSLDEFKDQIKSDITLYINSSKLINFSNFLSIISTSDEINPEEQLNNGISSFYFGNCTNIIKEYYKIPIEENLIIVNIELKNGKIQQYESNNNEDKSVYLGKDTEIEIFDYKGRKLNVSVCNEDIKIMKYIGDVKELDIESSKKFSNLGIDVFNPADKFFNDLCHPYDNPDNKDITLNDRRNDFYQNVTFCQDGCTYAGINYTLNIANCLCNTSFLQGKENNISSTKKESEKLNFKSITKSFIENLLSFNIEVVKCYNLALNPKILIHNYGFYSLFIMLILQVVFHILYLVKKLKSIRYFLLKFNDKNKINKNISVYNKNIIKNNTIFKKNYKNKFKGNFPPKNVKVKKRGKSPHTKIYFKYNVYNYKSNNDINLKNNVKNQENNNKKGEINSVYNSKDKMSNGKFSKFLRKKNTDKKRISVKNKNNLMYKKINKQALIKLSRTDYDLQDIDYEEAIIFDKRSYLRMCWGFLLDSQIILGTFFTDNHLDLFVIKLSFLVCTFQISFFLNALFYTDEYISDAYHHDGTLDFFSGLPKAIYSFVATLITTNLLRMLSNSKGELMQIIIERNSYKNYLYLIKTKLNKLKRKLIIYFILVHILELFFLYFVTAFCAVYRNSQKYWFFGCIESFGMDSLVVLIICILLALFRFISIKKRIKCFFVLANIISTFL